jgi:glyoxylase-like metal-dependent hydrolase (beta-lactamase superfamily II)
LQTLVSRIPLLRVRFLRSAWSRAIGIAALIIQVGFGGGGAAIASEHARPPTPSDWFHVFPLDEHTFAISEPKYWQENVSYLLIGSRRALLFDTGPGIYSIRAEVRRLTSLPVIAIPTHLHFDHVGDLDEFSDVRLLDMPELRAQVRGGYFVETSSQYQLRGSLKYRVHGWIKDGQTIDLGGRTVRLVSTPGHTPDSVSLVDANGERLFTGDLVNRVATLCAVPGSDVNQMAESLHRLLELGSARTRAYEAHAEAPLTWAEFGQLASGIADIAAGRQTASNLICLGGTPMRRFSVGPFPILLPVPGGVMQPPLASVTETVDFEGSVCN